MSSRPACPRTAGARSSIRIRPTLERLEDRLTPSWYSVPPSLVSIPLVYTNVGLSSQGSGAGNAAIAGTEVDWYRFVAPVSGTYTLEALTPSSSVDTVAGLYSSSGIRLGYNDDIGYPSNTDSRFAASLVAGRVYYLGVTNYVGTPAGAYTWRITGPGGTTGGDDAYEENDTFSTAYNLGSPASTLSLSNLVMADGHDWYRFSTTVTGTSSSSAAINFSNSQGNLDLELYSSSGILLGRSASTGNSEQLSLSGQPAGTYYVHVVGNQNNPNYSLVITPPASAPPPSGFSIQLRTSGLTSSQQAVFQQAAARWGQIITGDLPNASYNGVTVDDLLIDASAVSIDGRGGILGQAGPDRFRSGTLLPYHGTMQFDSADLASLESSGGLIYTVMHEIGHILGIGTIWNSRGLLSGAGTSNPRFTGTQATAQYNLIFGRNETGVPVENSGGSGTRDAHWRETTFGNELMTGYLNSGSNPLSRITAASLADLGYQVDLTRADSYVPPGGSPLSIGSSGSGGAAAMVASKTLKSRSILAARLASLLVPSAQQPRLVDAPNLLRPAEQARGMILEPGSINRERIEVTLVMAKDQPRQTADLFFAAQRLAALEPAAI